MSTNNPYRADTLPWDVTDVDEAPSHTGRRWIAALVAAGVLAGAGAATVAAPIVRVTTTATPGRGANPNGHCHEHPHSNAVTITVPDEGQDPGEDRDEDDLGAQDHLGRTRDQDGEEDHRGGASARAEARRTQARTGHSRQPE